MASIIENCQISSLDEALAQPLPFKIAVMDIKWVNTFPESLCLGRAEYFYCVDSWLYRSLNFVSETSVNSLDSLWINIVNTCIRGSVLYLNQHDPSSACRLRPDTTVMKDGTLLLKGEAKFDAVEMEAARVQLLGSFFSESIRCFPRNSRAVVGVTTCRQMAKVYKISFLSGHPTLTTHRSYDLQTTAAGRLSFIVDIFKAMRWMASVVDPVSKFHLIPSVRRETPNHHHVTWGPRGILKEYHNPRPLLIGRILEVYSHKLQHVEWGEAVESNQNAIMITRVADKLTAAIYAEKISREQAINHITLAVQELHSINLAHCDIVMDNVFVDDAGVAFLDDLEYLTPVNDPAPLNSRWNPAENPGLTAAQLDILLLSKFAAEVMRY